MGRRASRALACAENIRAINPTDLALSVSFTRLIWKVITALYVTHAPPGISSIWSIPSGSMKWERLPRRRKRLSRGMRRSAGEAFEKRDDHRRGNPRSPPGPPLPRRPNTIVAITIVSPADTREGAVQPLLQAGMLGTGPVKHGGALTGVWQPGGHRMTPASA